MKIEIKNTTKQKINKKILENAARVFSKKFKLKNKYVSVAIVGDGEIKKLNQNFRSIGKVTDVLSFSGDEDGEFFGEVVICYPQIKRQAKKLKTTIKEELLFIFMHGLLHLQGFNDETEKGWKQMEEVGAKLCKSVVARKN